MEAKFHEPVRSVCISGGTHGNELNGVYLVKNWLKSDSHRREIERKSFQTHVVLTNLRATEQCVRFTDVDLNRQITPENLFSTEERAVVPTKYRELETCIHSFKMKPEKKQWISGLICITRLQIQGPFSS